jgi:hypothetical protein
LLDMLKIWQVNKGNATLGTSGFYTLFRLYR